MEHKFFTKHKKDMKTETSTKRITPPAAKPLLAAVNWTPKFFADLDEKAEDGDYLREQQCCTGCGAYIGDLAGAYYLEDCDACPICRAASGEEKWSDEVKRIIKRQKMPKKEQKELIEAMAEYANV